MSRGYLSFPDLRTTFVHSTQRAPMYSKSNAGNSTVKMPKMFPSVQMDIVRLSEERRRAANSILRPNA